MDNELEQIIRNYLLEEMREKKMREAQARVSGDPLSNIANQLTLLTTKFDNHVERVDERFKGQEARLTKLEESAENTGNYNVEELRAKVKEERDGKTRVLGYVIAAMGALGLLGLGGAGTVVWYLITKGNHP